MGRVIQAAFALALTLGAVTPVWSATDAAPAPSLPKLTTPLEGRLWRALAKCEGALTEQDKLTTGCLGKLAIRQPDLIAKLIVPPLVESSEGSGISAEWVAVAVAGGLALGIVVGFVLAGNSSAQPIVVR